MMKYLFLTLVFSVGLLGRGARCDTIEMDEDTVPADDNYKEKPESGEKLQKQASETQEPQAQFVYNPYGVNDYTLGQLFNQQEPRSREPFYFYTRDEDEEVDERVEDASGPFEPFSFNEERINLQHFEKKKKTGDAEFRNLERGDYLDPSNVDRNSFLVVTGGLYPNNELFSNVPQLNFGKKAEIEFDNLRKKFRSTIQRYPPYYLDDPYEEYDPYQYSPPPEREVYTPKFNRPSLPPYTQPPPRRVPNKKKKAKPKTRKKPINTTRRKNRKIIENGRRRTEKPINRQKNKFAVRKARGRSKRPTRGPVRRQTEPPTQAPPRARSFPVDVIDDFGIFGRRLDFNPPKITPGDQIDQQYYGKAAPRKNSYNNDNNNTAPRRRRPTPRVAPRRESYDPYEYSNEDAAPMRPTRRPKKPGTGVARVYHYSTFGNSGNMRGFAYTIVV